MVTKLMPKTQQQAEASIAYENRFQADCLSDLQKGYITPAAYNRRVIQSIQLQVFYRREAERLWYEGLEKSVDSMLTEDELALF